MEFEWDPRKAVVNLRKHDVSLDEEVEAFTDENAIELYDDSHSAKEMRYQLVGLSERRLLFVGYTVREDVIRIITARKANARQEKYYNEQKR